VIILAGGGVEPGCCEPSGERGCCVRVESTLTGAGTDSGTFECNSVVVTGWMSSHYALLLSCLQQLCGDNLFKDGRFRKSEDDENNVGKSGLVSCPISEKVSSATMVALLDVFEDPKDGKSAADEKAALRTGEIRRALLKFMGTGGLQAVDGLVEKVGENS
jgi:hypothetical protein